MPQGRPFGACASATCRIRSRSRGALGYTRCTIAADQRVEKCTKNTPTFDKCSHAVSEAEGTSAKNQSRAGGALFINRKRVWRSNGNDATTCCIIRFGSFIPDDRKRRAPRIRASAGARRIVGFPLFGAISGHRELRMLQRYTHLRAADLVAKLG